jgi:hypothetical protein
MVWARLDDQFPQHRKVWPRSDAAFRLHVAGICHSSWLLLNGEIEANRVPGLVPSFKRKALDELLESGMWHAPGHDCTDCIDPSEGSYVIHGYLAVNPSDVAVKERRDATAERQRKYREKKAADKKTKGDASRDALRDVTPRDGAPDPDPTRPGPKGLGSGSGFTSTDLGPPPDTAIDEATRRRNVSQARLARAALRGIAVVPDAGAAS